MNILLVLIPLSLILVALAGWAFFWSVDNAQFDDLDTPALMPLSDDVPAAAVDDAEDER
jgi:cbb3-type cytochrome oxidase maturation protein